MTLTLLALPLLLATAAPAGVAAPRAAVVVGANGAAPGRKALRHAHRDAESIADVLTSVGRFPREQVHLLRDPSPEQLLAHLEREARALAGQPEAMLFFYFSGHADQASLWSGGRAVPLEALRRTLDRPDVGLRVGVIDACQGGGWTRAKGLVPDAPFEVPLPRLLESEGTALIASSSGEESAHESDVLGGSFFTVHFTAGLRGAADESGDGRVTLTKAFEYARGQTIRDTARHAREPQHPSYALNLRGRQDVVLTQVAASRSTLALAQEAGPVELIHLASGVRLLELPPGPRKVTLAVPPGRYLVRRVDGSGTRAREVLVPRDGRAEVAEHDLALVGLEKLVVKGGDGPEAPSARAFAVGLRYVGEQNSAWFLQVGDPLAADGESYPDNLVLLDGHVALGERIRWRVGTAAFAWRVGEAGALQLFPFGGLLSWNYDFRKRELRSIRLGAGLGARYPLGPASLIGNVQVGMLADEARPMRSWGNGGEARLSLGVGVAVGDALEFNLAGGLRAVHYPGQHSGETWGGQIVHIPAATDLTWMVGSVQELGFEALPLARLHLRRWLALDLNLHVGEVERGQWPQPVPYTYSAAPAARRTVVGIWLGMLIRS